MQERFEPRDLLRNISTPLGTLSHPSPRNPIFQTRLSKPLPNPALARPTANLTVSHLLTKGYEYDNILAGGLELGLSINNIIR